MKTLTLALALATTVLTPSVASAAIRPTHGSTSADLASPQLVESTNQVRAQPRQQRRGVRQAQRRVDRRTDRARARVDRRTDVARDRAVRRGDVTAARRIDRREDRRVARIDRREDVLDRRITRRAGTRTIQRGYDRQVDRRINRYDRQVDRRINRYDRRLGRNASVYGGRWNRGWRQDRRYDYVGYRRQNRGIFSAPRYYSPYRDRGYSRFPIGANIGSGYYNNRYWINDPYRYRLPPVNGGFRWVRYYNDVLLVDTRTGVVADSVNNFFY